MSEAKIFASLKLGDPIDEDHFVEFFIDPAAGVTICFPNAPTEAPQQITIATSQFIDAMQGFLLLLGQLPSPAEPVRERRRFSLQEKPE
jgi:hypothetical protein